MPIRLELDSGQIGRQIAWVGAIMRDPRLTAVARGDLHQLLVLLRRLRRALDEGG